jgi:hypothetical protein
MKWLQWLIMLCMGLMLVSAGVAQEGAVLWEDNFDDDDPPALKNVGWMYYGPEDGLTGAVVEQLDGNLHLKQGSFQVIGAVVAGTNGVPQIELEDDGDPTEATENAIKANNYSSPNQVFTYQVNFKKITQSFFVNATRMTIDSDSLDSDPTESPAYILFISPLQQQVGLAKIGDVAFALLDPTGYTYLNEMATFAFELDVYYWIKLYLNEGDFKVKIWEGPPDLEPDEWLVEAVDPEPRVNGQFTYFGLLNPDPNGTDEVLIDNVTMRAAGGTAVDSRESLPMDFALRQNYPNPFNPTTNIEFQLQHRGNVSLDIFNIEGQRVRSLVQESLPAGNHLMVWDGLDDHGHVAASGIYTYQLRVGNNVETKKMVMIR